MIFVIYCKKYVLGLVSGNFLNDESNKAVFCLWSGFWTPPKHGGCQRTKHVIKRLYSLSPSTSREERSRRMNQLAKAKCLSQSCLCNEDSLKPQKYWVQRASGLLNTRFGERDVPEEGMKALCPFLYLAPCISFIWLLLSFIFL